METGDLRKAILQYAMEGKLVKQDPNDEPASVLFGKIKQEKEKLIKEGEIKKDNKESYIYKGDDNHYYEKIGNYTADITDEIPFKVPSNWIWTRGKNLYKIVEGFSFKSNEYTDEGIKVVRISDFDYDGIKENGFRRYAYSERLDNFKIISEDILICMTGGTVGKNCFVTEINEDSYINQRVGIIRSSQFIKQKYIFYFLNTPYVKQYISAKKNSTNDNISSNDLESLFFPLPPICEQERIVRKLDNLMPLVDEYEKLLSENEKLDNEFLDKLKQSILQYAMEGKLVKQDPNDEPASVLLEKIKQEKEKLIKEGKIKRDKNESVIYKGDDKNYYEKIGNKIINITDEIPFDIPNNWEYVRIEQLGKFGMGQTILTKEMQKTGIPVYSATIKDEPLGYISENSLKIKLGHNDIVVPARGASIGYATLIKDDVATCTQTTIYCKFYVESCSVFIYYNFISNKKYYFPISGTAQPQVTITDFIKKLIALPPLSEQKHIIAKLDELNKLLL